jgi:mannosyl-3-phosphoglycerate synthase
VHALQVSSIELPHILANLDLLDPLFGRTAFIISHKYEPLATLLGVLWSLPANSPVIVVSNCAVEDLPKLSAGVAQLSGQRETYLVHQKDQGIADFFCKLGVSHLLDADGRVRDGKGEGMYIGALCAVLLGAEWIIYFDADNDYPAALVEYELAIGQLFHAARESDSPPDLHTVRISWASKPARMGELLQTPVLGRCTSVVSPILSHLFAWYGFERCSIFTSNAGEQGLTVSTARTLRFSSGYSNETFQLCELLYRVVERREGTESVLVEQYCAKSPHFHKKGSQAHIRNMIAQSLGCLSLFQNFVPDEVFAQVRGDCESRDIALPLPRPYVYPSLEQLGVEPDPAALRRYRLVSSVPVQNS